MRDGTFRQRRDAVLTDVSMELGTLVSSVGGSNPERNGSTKADTRRCVAFLNTSVPRHFVTVVCLLLIVHHVWMNRRS